MTDAMPIATLAAALVATKQKIENAKAALAVVEKEAELIEEKLAAAMQAAKLDNVQEGGRYIALKTTHAWSILDDEKSRALALLKEHAPGLVKETVHAASLAKWANDVARAKTPAPFWGEVRPLLEERVTTRVSVTKTKPRTGRTEDED